MILFIKSINSFAMILLSKTLLALALLLPLMTWCVKVFLRRAQLVALFSPHIRVYWKLRKSIYPGKFFWFLILFLRKMSRSHPSNLPIFPISEFHGIISSINLFQKLRFRLSGNLDSRFDQINTWRGSKRRGVIKRGKIDY